jgi:hypothetical protein
MGAGWGRELTSCFESTQIIVSWPVTHHSVVLRVNTKVSGEHVASVFKDVIVRV